MKFLEFFQQILLTDPTDSERKPVPTLDFNLPFTFSRLLVVIVKSCSDKAILYLPKSYGILANMSNKEFIILASYIIVDVEREGLFSIFSLGYFF